MAWHPSDPGGHTYGYMCAVSHNNMYPIASTLTPASHEGNLVLRVDSDPVERFASGLIVTLAVKNLMSLVLTIVGWPTAEIDATHPEISHAYALVQEADTTGS